MFLLPTSYKNGLSQSMKKYARLSHQKNTYSMRHKAWYRSMFWQSASYIFNLWINQLILCLSYHVGEVTIWGSEVSQPLRTASYFSEIKWPKCESNYSYPTYVEITNVWKLSPVSNMSTGVVVDMQTPYVLPKSTVVLKRIIRTERPPLVGDVSTNFCG
jgi:hypothetical protein